MAACVMTSICLAPAWHAAPVRSPAVRQPRSAVLLLDLPDVVPYVVGASLMGGLLLLTSDQPEDEYDRTRASKIMAPPLAPPPPQSPPPPTVTSPEHKELMAELSAPGFPIKWRSVVSELGKRAANDATVPEGESSLQARIAAVQAVARHRHSLAGYLTVAVERCLVEAKLSLMPNAGAIAPGAVLAPNAATLVRVAQQFPGQSARQVRAFVLESAPSNDAEVNGRFDRLQAARLYMGSVQFGYFVSQVFRGQAHLSDDETVTAVEAQEMTAAIQRATTEMKTEAAWLAASGRAGSLLGLPHDEGAEGEAARYESLRDFTVGVQVVGSAQQEEFFASPPSESGTPDAEGAAEPDGVDPLPTAEFVRFNAAGLQAMLAEGCLFGWLLWGAEAAARDMLESSASDEDSLLAPPATPS